MLAPGSNMRVFSISKGGVDHEDEARLRAKSRELDCYYFYPSGQFFHST